MPRNLALYLTIVAKNSHTPGLILQSNRMFKDLLVKTSVPQRHICQGLATERACVLRFDVNIEARFMHGMSASHQDRLCKAAAHILKTNAAFAFHGVWDAWVIRFCSDRYAVVTAIAVEVILGLSAPANLTFLAVIYVASI